MANNSIDDLKTLKGYALGVAGFATAISAILIQALHFPAEPTLLTVIGFAGLMLLIAYLINRSEQRQTQHGLGDYLILFRMLMELGTK